MRGRLAHLLVIVSVVGFGVAIAPVRAEAAVYVPSLRVGDATVVEGDSAKAGVKVPIELNAATTGYVYATYQVSGGSAAAGSDFVASKVKVTFLPGQTEKLANVAVYGDTTVEPTETVNVKVVSETGANVVDGSGTVSIVDDDANGVATKPEVAVGDATVWEGDSGTHQAEVPLTLSMPAPTTVKVNFQTCAGPNGAYAAVNKTVSFLKGERSKTIPITVYSNTVPSPNSEIVDKARVVSGPATVSAPAAGVALRDDDAAVPPPPGTYRVSEPAAGVDARFSPDSPCDHHWAADGSVSADGRYVAFTSNAINLVPGNFDGTTRNLFVKDNWTGAVEQINKSFDGSPSNGDAQLPQMTLDGRYVLYRSAASNLVPNDDNGWPDLFLYDRQLQTTERIGDIHQFHAGAEWGAVSDDGRYVTFMSTAVLAGDTDPCIDFNGSLVCAWPDVYLLDRTTGAITVVSTAFDGGPSKGYYPTISGDGTKIAYFANAADNVIAGVTSTTSGGFDIYEKDIATGAVQQVTLNNAGDDMQGWGVDAFSASMSGDGRYVEFRADVCNFGVPCNPTTGRAPFEDYVRDTVAHTTEIASVDTNGNPLTGVGATAGQISETGEFVAFGAPDAGTGCPSNVYIHNRDANTTVDVARSYITGGCPNNGANLNVGRPVITPDGNYIAYSSDSTDLTPNDTDNAGDVFITRRA